MKRNCISRMELSKCDRRLSTKRSNRNAGNSRRRKKFGLFWAKKEFSGWRMCSFRADQKISGLLSAVFKRYCDQPLLSLDLLQAFTPLWLYKHTSHESNMLLQILTLMSTSFEIICSHFFLLRRRLHGAGKFFINSPVSPL
jgi:hypothetical protein